MMKKAGTKKGTKGRSHGATKGKVVGAKRRKYGRKKREKGEQSVASWPVEARPLGVRRETLKLADIGFDDRNQRHVASVLDDEIRGLAATIATHGLQSVVQVRRTSARGKKAKPYVVVFGHRRVLAMRLLGWESAEFDVADALTPEGSTERRAIENIQHAGLTPIEEGIAVAQMLEGAPHYVTAASTPDDRTAAIAAVAERLGKSVGWVRQRDMLSRLSPKVQAMVSEGRLSLGKAAMIARLADPRAQEDVARIVDRGLAQGDEYSLDDVRDQVEGRLLSLAKVPWNKGASLAGAVACDACPHNSVNNRGLFEPVGDDAAARRGTARGGDPVELGATDMDGHGYCLNRVCFERKRRAAQEAMDKGVTKAVKAVQEAASNTDGPREGKAVKLTVSGLQAAGLVPPKLDADAFAAAVKSRAAAESPRPAAGQGRGAGRRVVDGDVAARRHAPKEPSADDAANQRWSERARAWMQAAEVKILEAVKGTPGRVALLMLISRSSLGRVWHDVYYGARTPKQRQEMEAKWRTPRLSAALQALKTPSLDALAALEADVLAGKDTIDIVPEIEAGVAVIAEALGIDGLGERPTLEACLAEVRQERAAAAKPAGDAPVGGGKEAKATSKDVAHRRKKSRAEAERELDAMGASTETAGEGVVAR